MKAVAANWCLKVRTLGDTPAALIVCPTLGRRYQDIARCCGKIYRPLGIQIVRLCVRWTHRNVDKKYFFLITEHHDLWNTLLHYIAKHCHYSALQSSGFQISSVFLLIFFRSVVDPLRNFHWYEQHIKTNNWKKRQLNCYII